MSFDENARRDELDNEEKPDIISIAFTLVHATEFKWFLKNFEMDCDPQKEKDVMSIIRQVLAVGKSANRRKLGIAAVEEENNINSGPSEISEYLHRVFVQRALPEIHRVMQPANLQRQGIQSLASPTTPCSSSCIAARLFISAKQGASNLDLLQHYQITHIVRTSEVPPPGGDLFAPEAIGGADEDRLLIAGFRDEEASGQLSEQAAQKFPADKMEQVLRFVSRKLAESPSNKILVHCAAGRHRSAWTCCAILAALAVSQYRAVVRHRAAAGAVVLPPPCDCLVQRTRHHKSLAFAAAEIVKRSRPFVDISADAINLMLSKWVVEALGLSCGGAGAPDDSDDDDDQDGEQDNDG